MQKKKKKKTYKGRREDARRKSYIEDTTTYDHARVHLLGCRLLHPGVAFLKIYGSIGTLHPKGNDLKQVRCGGGGGARSPKPRFTENSQDRDKRHVERFNLNGELGFCYRR